MQAAPVATRIRWRLLPAFLPPAAVISRLASGQSRALRNDEIKARWIRLVNPRATSDGPSSEPRLIAPAKTADVLARLDLERTALVLLDGSVDPPVCKLVDKSELLRSDREAKKLAKAARKTGGAPKEIQLSWATTENDLEHKLKPASKALVDGLKVDVIVATPPGRLGATSRAKSAEEKKALAATIDAAMRRIGGVKVGENYEGARVVKMVQKWEAAK